MSALAIFEVTIVENPTNEQLENYEVYKSIVPKLIKEFGGRYIIRGGTAGSLEGRLPSQKWHVIEFPDAEAVRAFWESEDYKKIKNLRTGVVEVRAVVVS